MRHPSRAPDAEQIFTTLYAAVRPDVVAFVRRRTGGASPAEVADDVAAETFLVVWRRLDELPRETDDARAWVFGIARQVLLNARRGERRGQALRVRLANPTDPTRAGAGPTEADGVVDRVDLARAWERLSDVHQEALSLAVFEGLNAPQAATVLGISPVAFRLRLSRARKVLRLHLDHQPSPAAPRVVGAAERTPS